MIKSFRCKETEKIFERESSKKFRFIERSAQRKLYWLDSVESLDAIKKLPGARLESLKGDRKGQFSIRINKQWRLCFKWKEQNAYDVEIVDYH